MERLTKRDENGNAFIVLDENSKEWSVSVDQPSYAHTIECEAVDKLADYEDAEEQGLLLRQEQKNGWISCSERVPDEEGNYCVTRKNGEVGIGSFFIWANGGCFNSYDNLYSFPDKEVIAWQPLPKPYEEAEQKLASMQKVE